MKQVTLDYQQGSLEQAVEDTCSTNEEKRVELYAINGSPTNPSSVKENTDLSTFNLNWKEKELPQYERTKHAHGLHPYLGKFIPQIVEIFLRKYFKAGQTVFDPFSGSGTTLIQANELDINSIGCDISAFNVLLTRAKAKTYSIDEVKHEIIDILKQVQDVSTETLFKNSTSCSEINTENEFLKSWYSPQALSELLTFRELIHNYKNQDILQVILSRSARSARMTTHFDLDFPKKPQTEPYFCHKHKRTCKPTQTAFKFLKRYSLDTIKRLERFSIIRTDSMVKVIHGDSRSVNPGYVDGIITSPPYVGLIDYHEQHRYAYELLGLEDRSSEEIGSASKKSTLAAKKEYQELIAEVFINALHYIPSDGYLIVIAGDRHNLYPKIAEICNVKEEAVIKRHVNRRTGRRSSEFYESIFVWKKNENINAE